ncbi:hypothetical protein CCM_07108 [Cordyceps militaris CM01]|uniref:NACHT domain-containing protein n=1 Tax=Cordyceps militaris (strain CM01) TaxID=983644 RepID=G3JLW4_CORMM|nr:uncharacterized protein CCM_07108 [Cordyceps militaris CM01]EGX90688.1 hypothetical protein CCM_07108 [Cordyceps militaris CM01]
MNLLVMEILADSIRRDGYIKAAHIAALPHLRTVVCSGLPIRALHVTSFGRLLRPLKVDLATDILYNKGGHAVVSCTSPVQYAAWCHTRTRLDDDSYQLVAIIHSNESLDIAGKGASFRVRHDDATRGEVPSPLACFPPPPHSSSPGLAGSYLNTGQMDGLGDLVQAAKVCQLLCYDLLLLEHGGVAHVDATAGPTNGSSGPAMRTLQERMEALGCQDYPASSSSEAYPRSTHDWVRLSEKRTAQLAAQVLGKGQKEDVACDFDAADDADQDDATLEKRVRECEFTVQTCLEQIARQVTLTIIPRQRRNLCLAAAELAAALDCPATTSSDGTRNVLQDMANTVDQALSAAKSHIILDLLKFHTLSERFESITQAEESTFRWLLRADGGGDDASSPSAETTAHAAAKERLLRWVRHEHGFFYISGKPGAGKSTLMKLICGHAGFAEHAAAWAGDAQLVTGRFFFWKPGHAEQKSIAGLLRGLLCSMLEQAPPALTGIAFPALWKDCSPERVAGVAVEHGHVQDAFHNILQAASDTGRYKVLLMIDGLDEFDGDHAELLALMRAWVAAYPASVKVCVSSREYGIFEDFFRQSPKMRLHELTRGDMVGLIARRLASNALFSSLAEDERRDTMQLMTERAEGVFLWVVMVVAAMDDVILSGAVTNARELQRSIQDCPTEMDSLLSHLLSTVSIHNRPWAYKAISLVTYAQFKVPEMVPSKHTAPGVGLLDLMLLDEASPSWNMSAFQPRSESKSTDPTARLPAARLKVLSRCKGFLSVITIAEAACWPANGDERMYVAVTHRSVVEFLHSDAARGIMALYLTHFSPFFALFSTMLACLRFLAPSNYPLLRAPAELARRDGLELGDVLAPSLQDRWRELIHSAFLTGQSGSPRFFSILDAVGDAIKRHLVLQLTMRKISLSPTKASPHQLLSLMTLEKRIPEYSAWRRGPGVGESVRGHMSLSLFRAFHRAIRYFQLNDYEYPALGQDRAGTSLVNKPVDWIKWTGANKPPSVSEGTLTGLLTEFFERGLDLNWTCSEATSVDWDGPLTLQGEPWTCWQALLWAMLLGEIPFSDRYALLIDSLIRHGADTSVDIFSTAPVESIHMERLTPQSGWVLLIPFAGHDSFNDAAMEKNVADAAPSLGALYSRVPALLVRDTAPLYLLAKSHNWHLTVRDLVTTWLPNEGGYFKQLFDAVDQGALTDKRRMPPPLNDTIVPDAGILGQGRGACDLEIYLEEKRVAAGLRGDAATIRRNIKLG